MSCVLPLSLWQKCCSMLAIVTIALCYLLSSLCSCRKGSDGVNQREMFDGFALLQQASQRCVVLFYTWRSCEHGPHPNDRRHRSWGFHVLNLGNSSFFWHEVMSGPCFSGSHGWWPCQLTHGCLLYFFRGFWAPCRWTHSNEEIDPKICLHQLSRTHYNMTLSLSLTKVKD